MQRDNQLGPLEAAVMDILWARGESSVHEVTPLVERPLAYTTVMTTLDRLYKKGLLDRRRVERAFLYRPRYSRAEWDRMRAGELMAGILAGPEPSREALISCFLDTLGAHDAGVLDQLEARIRERRRELKRRRP